MAGTVCSGRICTEDRLLLGPDSMTGRFEFVRVRSIHNKRVPVDSVSAGQSATMAISSYDENMPITRRMLRKGVVLVNPKLKPVAAREIDVDLLILYHPSGISRNYQIFVHAQTVCQQVEILSMPVHKMRTGHRSICRLRFMFHAEYLHEGSTLFVRDGKGKGVGTILKLYTDPRDDGTEEEKTSLEKTPDSPGRNTKVKMRRHERRMKRLALNRERSESEELRSDPETVEGQSRIKLGSSSSSDSSDGDED